MTAGGFFQSAPFGLAAPAVAGASRCITGVVMGDAPKWNIPASAVLRGGLICLCRQA